MALEAEQRVKDMGKHQIVSDPKVAMGKPVVVGTRITVEHILEKLGAGESIEDLMAAHPRLTQEGIRAALAYSAEVLRSDRVYPVEDTAA